MKKQLLLFLAALLPMMANADDSGTCGDNLTWTYVEANHTLTISGNGNMTDYWSGTNAPWYSYKDEMAKVIIEKGVKSIGDIAFYNCSSLTSITIPNSVTSIGISAFSGCSDLTSIVIRDGVVSIGKRSFYSCRNLTSITFGCDLTSIGEEAFSGCTKISCVFITNIVAWCSLSFADSFSFLGIEPPSPYTYSLFIDGVIVKNLTIPDGTISISKKSFKGCSSIESITIPNSVTSIGIEAFAFCDNLLTVYSEITEPYNCKNVFSENTLRKGALYIPAGTKDLYTRFDGWREFLKIEEVGGAPEESVWLTLKDSQGASKLKLKKGVEQELAITPEEGWKLLTVTMDGTDVTAQVKNGNSFTTPAIMQDAVITIVYEQEVPSEVAGARLSKANVKVVDDGVIIMNAEPDTRCMVYQSNGQQVTSVIIDGDSRKITLQKGQVYILTIGDRTLKFAL